MSQEQHLRRATTFCATAGSGGILSATCASGMGSASLKQNETKNHMSRTRMTFTSQTGFSFFWFACAFAFRRYLHGTGYGISNSHFCIHELSMNRKSDPTHVTFLFVLLIQEGTKELFPHIERATP